jgi:hypothetical protein
MPVKKIQQNPVEALQQGVMKFPCNPGALADARLQRHFELIIQLPRGMVEMLSLGIAAQLLRNASARHARTALAFRIECATRRTVDSISDESCSSSCRLASFVAATSKDFPCSRRDGVSGSFVARLGQSSERVNAAAPPGPDATKEG